MPEIARSNQTIDFEEGSVASVIAAIEADQEKGVAKPVEAYCGGNLSLVAKVRQIAPEIGLIVDGLDANPVTPPTEMARLGSRYQITHHHRDGGIGSVFAAHDTEVNRPVALKEIQPDKDRDDLRTRFLFEAEVTGRLQHPGIVPVYGLGRYADGKPYYAMRFIEGENLGTAITRFHQACDRGEPLDSELAQIETSQCQPTTQLDQTRPNSDLLDDKLPGHDSNALTGGAEKDKPSRKPRTIHFESLAFRRLLQRFIDVCEAIAYAHSKGVLHRDIKPGNIMLGRFGETLVVDWGLAKTHDHYDKHGAKGNGESPLSMPLSADGVRTDAGGILGTAAYMAPEQAKGRLDQLSPASDVFCLGATLYHLLVGKPPYGGRDVMAVLTKAQNCEFDLPRFINPAVPKALEAVCRKAMALTPSDRYASSTEFAADIEHWLADEPVSAMAEPVTVRTKRWMRKHPGTVAALAASLVVGVIGISGLAWQKEQARSAIAIQETETAKQRDLADGRFDMALNAFNQMVFDMQSLLEQRAGTVEVRRELLAKARPGLEKLLQEAEAARGADHTLCWAYFGLGDVLLKLGDVYTANTEFTNGHVLAQRLLDAEPGNVQAQRDLSCSFNKLGDVARQMGDVERALEYYRKNLDICQRLADADPNNTEAQRDLSISFNNLGDVTRHMSKVQEALEYYRKSLGICQRLADANPKNAKAQRDLSISFCRLGDLTIQISDASGALEYCRKMLNINQQLADADPKNAEAQRDLSVSFNKLGDVTLQMGNPPGALENYRKMLDINQRLADADPKNAEAQCDLSVSFTKLGDVSLLMGNARGSLEYYRKSQEIDLRLADAEPKNTQAQRDLSVSFTKLGDVSLLMGNTVGSLEYYRKGQEIDLRLADADPKNTQAQRDLSLSFSRLGNVTLQMGDSPGALEYYRKYQEYSQRLTDADPKNRQAQLDLSVSFSKLGDVTLQMGNAPMALKYYHKYQEFSQQLADADPKNAQAQMNLFVSIYKMAEGMQADHQFSAALERFQKAMAKLEQFEMEGWIKKPEGKIGAASFQQWLDEIKRRSNLCDKVEKTVASLDFALNQPPDEVPRLLDARMRVLTKKESVAACLATAEAMADLKKTDADGLYNTACLWSICAGVAKDRKNECCEKALDCLKRAIAAGYRNVGHMKKDEDLDILRDREDFKRLIAELEAKPPANKLAESK